VIRLGVSPPGGRCRHGEICVLSGARLYRPFRRARLHRTVPQCLSAYDRMGRDARHCLIPTASSTSRESPDAIRFVPFDLGDVDKIQQFVAGLRKSFGPIYGLVNNAALGTDGAQSLMPEFQDCGTRASQYAVADCAHQICGARHDGGRRRPHRQCSVDRGFYGLQRALLLGDGARRINGTVLTVDAGSTA
jgi:hypothetical protein